MQTHHFMTNRWQKKWKQWQSFFSWAPKSLQTVNAAIKLRLLFLGRKAMTNLDSILKSRDITLLTKVCIVKAMVFPVVMYGCESCPIKKSECQRTDAFELWVLRVTRIARGSNQSILKEINPECSVCWKDWCWSWNFNTLATWCEEPTHWERPWCWERLRARGEGGDRGWDGWMASLTQWTWIWANWGETERQGSLACYSLWGCKGLDMT